MEYITSKGYGSKLPVDPNEMETFPWFNMWQKRNFPYTDLIAGDTLYWFDTRIQKLVWKTEVIDVERFPYADKQKVFEQFKGAYTLSYYDSRPDIRYFIHYKVKIIERLDMEKPKSFRFPQLGWLKVSDEVASIWFNRLPLEDSNVLDDIIDDEISDANNALVEINKRMQNVRADRIEKTVLMTIRKDTRIISLLKKAAHYQCQFPGCECRIAKKGGGFYVEVAHIKPVKENGQSVLGNLIALCPNHHKEFDVGELNIFDQTPVKITGELNGKSFLIEITNHPC